MRSEEEFKLELEEAKKNNPDGLAELLLNRAAELAKFFYEEALAKGVDPFRYIAGDFLVRQYRIAEQYEILLARAAREIEELSAEIARSKNEVPFVGPSECM